MKVNVWFELSGKIAVDMRGPKPPDLGGLQREIEYLAKKNGLTLEAITFREWREDEGK